MAYEPYNWTTASYVNPGNMNHLEQGVAGASATAEKAASDITKTNKDLTDLSGVVTTLNSNFNRLQGNLEGSTFVSDCNEVKTTCVRYGQTPTLNRPADGNGILCSFAQTIAGNVVLVYQIYTIIYSNGSFHRTYNNGTWSAWKEF